jgi:hypothetical protein
MIGRSTADVLRADPIEKQRPHIRTALSGRRVEHEHHALGLRARHWIYAGLGLTFDPDRAVDSWVTVIHKIDDSQYAAAFQRRTLRRSTPTRRATSPGMSPSPGRAITRDRQRSNSSRASSRSHRNTNQRKHKELIIRESIAPEY